MTQTISDTFVTASGPTAGATIAGSSILLFATSNMLVYGLLQGTD